MLCFLISVSVYSGLCPRSPLPFWIPKRKRKKNMRLRRLLFFFAFCFVLFSFYVGVFGASPPFPTSFLDPKKEAKKEYAAAPLAVFLFFALFFCFSLAAISAFCPYTFSFSSFSPVSETKSVVSPLKIFSTPRFIE